MANLRYLFERARNRLRTEGVRSTTESMARYLVANVIQSEIYYQLKYGLRQLHQRRKHGPVPHAFDIRWVSPGEVQRISGTLPTLKWKKAGLVEPGEWDLSDRDFADYDLFRAFRERFEEGSTWESTNFYQRVSREIDSGQMKWGCRSIDEFDARCQRMDQLYDSIKQEGYKRRTELHNRYPTAAASDDFAAISHSILYKYDEIAIDVGRDGELLFVDGRNRLAICKLLDIDRIPVRIVRRHERWQDRRRTVAANPGLGCQHPDLIDII